MLSSTSSIALLALSSLALALPQQQQSAQTGQAINPINGLPLPGAASSDDSSAASQAAPTLTGNSRTSPTSSPSSPDDSSESDSASASLITITSSASLITITSSASLATATDASSPPTDSSPPSEEEDSPVVIIWTDTAQNTIYTVTRSTTTSIPIPTMQVPPDHATATMMGPDGKPTPTSEVDTFVQGYTGAGERVEVGDGRVWWLLLGAAAAVGAAVL